MSFPSGLYTLRASPAVGVGGLYATGNGVDEDVTVAPQSPPFVERQVVSIMCLHAFRMIKLANVLLPILFSGTFKPSMESQANTPSLSTRLEAPLEDIGSRRTQELFLRSPSLLRKSLTNGTLHIRILRTFPTPSRTYTWYILATYLTINSSAFKHIQILSAWGCMLELMIETKWAAYTLWWSALANVLMPPGCRHIRSRRSRCRGTLLAIQAPPSLSAEICRLQEEFWS